MNSTKEGWEVIYGTSDGVIQESNDKVANALRQARTIYSVAESGGAFKPRVYEVIEEICNHDPVVRRRCTDNLYYSQNIDEKIPAEFSKHQLNTFVDNLTYPEIYAWIDRAITRVLSITG